MNVCLDCYVRSVSRTVKPQSRPMFVDKTVSVGHLSFRLDHSTRIMRPSQGFWRTGKKGIYFRGTGEQRPNFEGNRGTKTILGNREHKKIFDFWGTGEQVNLFQGNKGTGTPPPHTGRASIIGTINI